MSTLPSIDKRYLYSILIFLFAPLMAFGQTISGTVVDDATGETMIGVAVIIKDTEVGAVTDLDGNFSFEARQKPPFVLLISYLGFETLELAVTADNIGKPFKVKLKTSATQVEGVEITAQRISEKEMEEPLTVESMNLAAIKETPSSSFYNGLGALKGVDLTTASMGFVVINTRGFNSTRPVRTLQLVDGADNQAPGLNFSLGNFVGSSELDIQKVDLIVGASSAMFGPNAFNGVINMQTKNPFFHKGLSVMIKGGERNLFEGAVRYARSFANKKGRDIFAFKVNFSYLRADDWQADNASEVDGTPELPSNLGGYDAVNTYADENITAGTNNYNSSVIFHPGLGTFHRTGYQEADLVNYNTRNMKIGTALHYRITQQIEAKYSFNYGAGTTVYQGDNRYSLKGLQFFQHQIEVAQQDKFFVRAYYTMEDAGDSYDAVFAALLLQTKAKPDSKWGQDYSGYWRQNVTDKIWNLEGYPDPTNPLYANDWFGAQRESTIALADSIMGLYPDSLAAWHNQARTYADGIGNVAFGFDSRYIPGTALYDSVFNDVVSKTTFLEGGAKFYDKSSLSHIQGEYTFNVPFVDISVGGNFRMYTPDSRGTIFLDTAGTKITNWEVGFYTGATAKLAEDKLILTFTARLDKNENFNPLVSPAASVIWKYNPKNTFRFSFSSAIRNPTLQDQYLYYNVGRALLIGNLNGFTDLVTTDSYFASFSGATFERDSLEYFDIDPVRPEKVKSVEIGYKGILFKSVFIDASYYYSWYTDFLGYKIGAEIEIDSTINNISKSQFYRVSANSPDLVSTQGFSIGVTYGFAKYYALTGNYSWNVLDRRGSEDPIIPAFNTPAHKFNVGISGRDIVLKMGNVILKNWGFNVNFKWVQGYLFEGSPQFTGTIDSYGLLDAQINYHHPKWHTTFKLGATNLLNNKTYQTYGGPRIGRLTYASILFEFDGI